MADRILNIRVPHELEQRIEELAGQLGVKKSTAARLLLRRALDEPLGVAAIKEKVAEVSAVIQRNAGVFATTLRNLMFDITRDLEIAEAIDLPNVLELPGVADEEGEPLEPAPDADARFTPAPVHLEPMLGEDEDDHGAGVRFGSTRKSGGAALGRRKKAR